MRQMLIDSRVGSKEVLSGLANLGCKCKLFALEFADFAFEGSGPDGTYLIGIERKVITDMLDSMRTGRLSGHQIPGMSQMYDRRYIVIEGRYRPSRDGYIEVNTRKGSTSVWGPLRGREQFLYAELDNFINSIEEHAGFSIKRTGNIQETAHCVANLYAYWQKEYTRHKAHKAFYTPPNPVRLYPPNVRERVAKELVGVGQTKARAVAKKFKTLEAMFTAAPADWESIEGVGKTMAKRIIGEIKGQK